MGFTLTSSDVADILGKTQSEVHDLVRVNELPGLILGESTFAGACFLFHPDEVAKVEVRHRELSNRSTLASDTRNRLRVLGALRCYLESTPATDDYDEAITRGMPLWGTTRNGTPVLHVRAEAVASFGVAFDGAMVSTSMARSALDFFGAIRARGVTPAATPGQQRWGVWFRLAEGFAPGENDEASVIRGLISGAREPGERMTRRGMGAAYLATPIGPDETDHSDTNVD